MAEDLHGAAREIQWKDLAAPVCHLTVKNAAEAISRVGCSDTERYKLAVIGDDPLLSNWGADMSPTILIPGSTPGSWVLDFCRQRRRHFEGTFVPRRLEYRFLIWDAVKNRVEAAEIGSYLPRFVFVAPSYVIVEVDVAAAQPPMLFAPRSTLRSVPFESAVLLRMFISTKMIVSLTGHGTQKNSPYDEIDLVQASSIHCSEADWSFAGIPCQIRSRNGSSSPISEPLQTMEPLQSNDPGIDASATRRCWCITFNVLNMQQRIPCFKFNVNKSSSEGAFYLHPSQFRGVSHASIVTTAATSDNNYALGVHITFMFVTPICHNLNNLSFVRSIENTREMQSRAPIGHRGAGMTLRHSARSLKLTENTIESFIAASHRGCEFIEFDVQLTKDNVPIVFHDFVVRVRVKERPLSWRTTVFAASALDLANLGGATPFAKSGVSVVGHAPPLQAFEPMPVGIHQLTRRQLEAVEVEPCPRGKSFKLRDLVTKYWRKILRIARRAKAAGHHTDKHSPPRSHGFAPDLRDVMSTRIPQFEDMLRLVPVSLGLLIEVKFPYEMVDKERFVHPHFEANKFVDRILEVLWEAAPNRHRVLFCSFDPEICIALQLKQARYPVFFLCNTGDQVKDSRCESIESGIQFAVAERFAGVSIGSLTLLRWKDRQLLQPPYPLAGHETPRLRSIDLQFGTNIVKYCADHGLLVLTWGSENVDPEWAALQHDVMKVNGVITDSAWGQVPSSPTVVHDVQHLPSPPIPILLQEEKEDSTSALLVEQTAGRKPPILHPQFQLSGDHAIVHRPGSFIAT